MLRLPNFLRPKTDTPPDSTSTALVVPDMAPSVIVPPQPTYTEAEVKRFIGELVDNLPKGNVYDTVKAYWMNNMERFSSPGQDPRFRPYTPLSTDALRLIARTYDPIASCIVHLKQEVTKVPLKIVLREGERETAAVRKVIQDETRFFSQRGGLGGAGVRRSAFEGQMLDDILIIGGGVAAFDYATTGDYIDGTFTSCRAIDAATIRILITAYGLPASDDDPAYEQWVNGIPGPRFSRRQMDYETLPILARTDSPYPLSLVELCAMVAYTAMKSDEWNRAWLTDGNGRGKYVHIDPNIPADKATEWLDVIDLMTAGNAKERHKLGVIPGTIEGGETRKDADFEAFSESLANRCRSIFGVNPASVGHNTGQYENNQDAAMGSTREGMVAHLLEWRSEWYDELLARRGYPYLRVAEDVPAKEETVKERTERQRVEIESGMSTINEVRAENGKEGVEGGDVSLVSSNLAPLSSVAAPPEPAPNPNDENANEEDEGNDQNTDESSSLGRAVSSGKGAEWGADEVEESPEISKADVKRAPKTATPKLGDLLGAKEAK